jgi:hypothetical protein
MQPPQQPHRRHHRRESRLRQFTRKYRFEIIWLAVIGLGVFLILERMNIRQRLFGWLRAAIAALASGIGQLISFITDIITHTRLSNAIGYLLILAALGALVLRVRWRLMRAPTLTTIRCPECGGEIHRVHRHTVDYLINVFVPVRRYRCSNRECRWYGLRIATAAPRGRPSPSPR